jgi:hypothetical protein
MSDDCDSKMINSFMTFGYITKGMTQCLFEYSVCYDILSVSLFQTRWHHQLGDFIFLITLQSIRYASSTRIEQLESYSYTVYLPKGLYTIVIGGAKKNGLCCCWWPASTDRISRGLTGVVLATPGVSLSLILHSTYPQSLNTLSLVFFFSFFSLKKKVKIS